MLKQQSVIVGDVENIMSVLGKQMVSFTSFNLCFTYFHLSFTYCCHFTFYASVIFLVFDGTSCESFCFLGKCLLLCWMLEIFRIVKEQEFHVGVFFLEFLAYEFSFCEVIFKK